MSPKMHPPRKTPTRRRFSPPRRSCLAPLLGLCLLAAAPGCGTSAGNTLFNAASAAGTTVFDLLLTAAVNGLLDVINPLPPSTTQPSGGSGGGGGNFDGLTGDATNGQALFMANNCPNCHCPDASGGCALNAPRIAGVSVNQVDDRLRGQISHPGGKFTLTDQEIVDIQAFLASL